MRALESIIDRLRIHSLNGQIEASRLYCVALTNRFDAATTGKEKTKLAHQYDEALTRVHALQLLLALLERKRADEKAKTHQRNLDLR